MKKTSVFGRLAPTIVFFALSATMSMAQTNPKPGYVVTNDGDTRGIRGTEILIRFSLHSENRENDSLLSFSLIRNLSVQYVVLLFITNFRIRLSN